jgi:N-acyl-phosphatidylethanolamine-hydrolysing phospholipase D
MKKRFINPHSSVRPNFCRFLLWRCGYYGDKRRLPPVPKDFDYPNSQEPIDPERPCATWVNHSTFMVKAFQTTILTDPIWNARCSPVSFIGPKRFLFPRPPLEAIEKVDYVLISHNHYDHLDKHTINQLLSRHDAIRWILPKGLKKWFVYRFGVIKEHVVELSWWETHDFREIKITSVPAQHFSGRTLADTNRTLWMGVVVEFQKEGKRLYFAGDTGYNAHDFKTIGAKFKTFDLSLIPIGSYIPRRFMSPMHINPEEALMIHKEVGSKLSIGCHWGTFKLSSESLDRPPFDLYCALQKEKMDAKHFRVLQPGQSINW